MDSQLTRDVNPKNYLTTIRRGFISLGLGSRTGLCELWISSHADCRKHGKCLDTSFVQNFLSRTHTRHVPLWTMWATMKALSKFLPWKNFKTPNIHFRCMTTCCSAEYKWRYCLNFNDVFFLSSTGFAHKFAYLHNNFHIQFVSKHLTCCIRHCFKCMTIDTYITYQQTILQLFNFLLIYCFDL